MSSDPSVEFSAASHPGPPWPGEHGHDAEWHAQSEPLDPHWTPEPEPQQPAQYWTPPPPPPPAGEPYPSASSESPGRRRTWRQWRFGPRSLTGRLVSGVVALVVALVLATGICTYVALRSFLFNRLDQQVQSLATQNANFVSTCFRFGCRANGGPPPSQTEWLGFVPGDSVDVLQLPAQIHLLTLSSATQSELSSDADTVQTITADHVTLRVRAVGIGNGLFVITGLSTDEVHRTLRRLVILEWIIGAAAIVLAFLATTYGVRFSLRRLHGVTATAQEVASELSPEGAGLDRRVEIDDPDTEVGRLAESMNTLLAAVETQFAARLAHEEQMRQFLADASHELRTPLTSIRGYAELARMQRGQSGAEATDSADNIARIEAEGTRMSRLVDDLLTLARTDQGSQPVREWVDVDDLLDEVVSGVRAAYPGRRIDLSTAPGLGVIGDRDQLVRVVRNLVTNAAVHTRPDGPISVSASRDAYSVSLRIADTGPGLPPDEAAHVFERFWRADKARTRARGGSGLGLAIVASLVQAHGGNVRFDSSVEHGSVVTVNLPAGTS